jgi:hypothetical protein
VKYLVPTRGLLGLKNALLSATKGNAVLNTQFVEYGEFLGDFSTRENGSLVAFETGQVTAYAIASAQERGVLMCKPGDQVYEGQVVGVHQRGGDLKINVCKKKALTNMRASGKDTYAASRCTMSVIALPNLLLIYRSITCCTDTLLCLFLAVGKHAPLGRARSNPMLDAATNIGFDLPPTNFYSSFQRPLRPPSLGGGTVQGLAVLHATVP